MTSSRARVWLPAPAAAAAVLARRRVPRDAARSLWVRACCGRAPGRFPRAPIIQTPCRGRGDLRTAPNRCARAWSRQCAAAADGRARQGQARCRCARRRRNTPAAAAALRRRRCLVLVVRCTSGKPRRRRRRLACRSGAGERSRAQPQAAAALRAARPQGQRRHAGSCRTILCFSTTASTACSWLARAAQWHPARASCSTALASFMQTLTTSSTMQSSSSRRTSMATASATSTWTTPSPT
mmetsp:Transcript_5926/g.18224  ORF Transcript_5926/g.18224 Transcript_5926/m.18224 type:complete len:240 (+) Transcript_5926:3924-4643(+)